MCLVHLIPDMQNSQFQNSRGQDEPQHYCSKFIISLWVPHLPFAHLHSRCLSGSHILKQLSAM